MGAILHRYATGVRRPHVTLQSEYNEVIFSSDHGKTKTKYRTDYTGFKFKQTSLFSSLG